MKSRKFNLIKWLLSFPCLLFTLLSISRFLDLLLLLFKTFWYYRDSHSMRNELECVLKSLSRKDKKKCDMKWNWKYQKKTGSSHLKDRLIVNCNFDSDSMSLASCHEIWTFSSTFPSRRNVPLSCQTSELILMGNSRKTDWNDTRRKRRVEQSEIKGDNRKMVREKIERWKQRETTIESPFSHCPKYFSRKHSPLTRILSRLVNDSNLFLSISPPSH